MQFTHLTCTVQWPFVDSWTCATGQLEDIFITPFPQSLTSLGWILSPYC